MSKAILEKMKAKLQRLEEEFSAILAEDPRIGHGGTPNILDNSKGRRMAKCVAKLEERLIAKDKAIKEQKEKIQRMESRIAYRSTQTKKSQKFLDKNPIHQGLFELEKLGHVKQWKRNPQYFFVVGLERVALATFDGVIARCARFQTKTPEETARAQELIDMALSLS